MRNINWGIISAGIIAKKMANAISHVPNTNVIGVASKSLEKAKKFAQENNIKNHFSYNEIVNCKDIDVIYVASTHNFHFENAKLALEHGKHVVIEKAFTVNAEQASQLVNIARQKNLFLMEAIWTRFLPSINLLKNQIKSSQIGDVKEIDVSFGQFVPPKFEKRLKSPDLAGGTTLDMGIYPISFVCYLLDELPIEVKSMTYFSDSGVDEISNYMFRFPSGCFANIKTSYNLMMRNEAIIYGDKGYIEFPNFQSGKQFTLSRHGGTNNVKEVIEFTERNNENGFVYQVEEVVKYLQENKLESSIISLNESVAIMKIMDKMRKDWGFKYPFE